MMKHFICAIALLLQVEIVMAAAADATVSNIFLVTLDGLRWQEVFRGLDESLATNGDYTGRSETIIARYGASNAEDSAAALMPFLHNTVFRDGTVVGNRDRNSCARVSNSWYFSYPGYNEILTGVVDESIDSKDRKSVV
jgi:hypothetical protein